MVAGEKRTESGPDWDWPDVGPEYLWPLDLTDCSCGTKDEHQGEGWTQTLWTVTSVSCADSTKTENRIADTEVCRSSNVTHWFCWRKWNKILNCSHVSHTHTRNDFLPQKDLLWVSGKPHWRKGYCLFDNNPGYWVENDTPLHSLQDPLSVLDLRRREDQKPWGHTIESNVVFIIKHRQIRHTEMCCSCKICRF